MNRHSAKPIGITAPAQKPLEWTSDALPTEPFASKAWAHRVMPTTPTGIALPAT